MRPPIPAAPSGQTLRAEMLAVFRSSLLGLLALSMVINLLMLAPTLYMLQIYDRVLVSRSEATLLVVSLFTLGLLGVMAAAEWLRSRALVHTGLRMDAALGSRVFHAGFTARLRQSRIPAHKAFTDLIEIRQFLSGSGILGFLDAPWTPIYIAVLFVLHPLLGWVAVAFALVQLALAAFGHRRAGARSQALSDAYNEEQQFLHGKLRNAEIVESMGMFMALKRRWWARHRAAMDQYASAQGQTHRLVAWSKWFRYSQQSLGLAAGAWLVIQGELSPGAMIAANVLLSRALAPIDQMVGVWKGFLAAAQAYQRLVVLLAGDVQPRLAPLASAPVGRIELQAVDAHAPGGADPVLRGVSLIGHPGQVTVVIGPSGSGKSTLARLLVGAWTAARGEVLLDGVSIASHGPAALGPHVGYLPQDVELLRGTIAENIARFDDVDPDRVIAAARAAGLHELILRMPQGYDTPVGEAGRALSGGQRQRIGLARALYGTPVLVVLDEPNSNLDEAGEQALLEALRQMKERGQSVWVVAQRPGVVAAADQLVVLTHGIVAAAGPRESVLGLLKDNRARAEGSSRSTLEPLDA